MKKLWPALVALVVLAVVYFVMTRGGDEPAVVSQAPAPSAPSAPSVTTTAPALPGVPAIKPPAPTTEDEDEWLANKPLVPDDVAVGTRPKAKKPKMTLDERLAEAKKHIPVIEERAAILEKEIEQLDRDGKTQEAREQRIVVKRLRGRIEDLRAAIAEGRDPK